MRPFKIFVGVAYPIPYTEADQPARVSASLANPEEYYYDDAVRLHKDELDNFKGKPIRLEHNPDKDYGTITDIWMDQDNKVRMSGRVYTDTEEGKDLFEQINRGDLRCLSVGYKFNTDASGRLTEKRAQEISVCREGFFPTAISVAASKLNKYSNSPGEKFLNFEIMSEPPLDQANKDASELARRHDVKVEQNDKLLQELQAQKAELEQLRAEREQRIRDHQIAVKPKLDEVLQLQKEQYKEQYGESAEMPADAVDVTTKVFMDPSLVPHAKVIEASVMTWRKAKDERARQLKEREAEVAASQAKIKELEARNLELAAKGSQLDQVSSSVAASRDIVGRGSAATNIPKTSLDRIFTVKASKPSATELELLKKNYGTSSESSVNASVGEVAQFEAPPELPDHLKEQYKNGMRFKNPGVFAMMYKNSEQLARTPLHGFQVVPGVTETLEK